MFSHCQVNISGVRADGRSTLAHDLDAVGEDHSDDGDCPRGLTSLVQFGDLEGLDEGDVCLPQLGLCAKLVFAVPVLFCSLYEHSSTAPSPTSFAPVQLWHVRAIAVWYPSKASMNRELANSLGYMNERCQIDVDIRYLNHPDIIRSLQTRPNFIRDSFAIMTTKDASTFVAREVLLLAQILCLQERRLGLGVDAGQLVSAFFFSPHAEIDPRLRSLDKVYCEPWTVAPGQSEQVDAVRQLALDDAQSYEESVAHVIPSQTISRLDEELNGSIPMCDIVRNRGEKRKADFGTLLSTY
jgi:hypothetical protein